MEYHNNEIDGPYLSINKRLKTKNDHKITVRSHQHICCLPRTQTAGEKDSSVSMEQNLVLEET